MIVGILKNFDDARGSFTKLFNKDTKVNYFGGKEIKKEINFSRTEKNEYVGSALSNKSIY